MKAKSVPRFPVARILLHQPGRCTWFSQLVLIVAVSYQSFSCTALLYRMPYALLSGLSSRTTGERQKGHLCPGDKIERSWRDRTG